MIVCAKYAVLRRGYLEKCCHMILLSFRNLSEQIDCVPMYCSTLGADVQ